MYNNSQTGHQTERSCIFMTHCGKRSLLYITREKWLRVQIGFRFSHIQTAPQLTRSDTDYNNSWNCQACGFIRYHSVCYMSAQRNILIILAITDS